MRAAILDAARTLLLADGVEGLSMRAIARELGYSPAGLYEYFPSKEMVTCALFFEGSEGLAGHMQGALDALPADASDVDRLRAIGRTYRDYAKTQPDLYLLTFGGRADWMDRGLESAEERHVAFDLLVQVVEDGLRSGGFIETPAQPLAIAAWSGIHGFVMLEVSGFLDRMLEPESPETLDRLFESALNVFENGYRRR
ncbi:MAG: TetR/AcrR family transcriptional regulator [Rhizobiales bacterium]|nr:TetR/AcrR family transcriptional regulator [Hyphomicrobiales bacterium]